METKNVVKQLMEQAEQKRQAQERFQEEIESLKADANHCFGTPSGKKIAKFMMKASGIYNVNKNATDPAMMGEQRGMAKMYLLLVKGMCSPDLIAEIERPQTEGEN